MTGNTHKSWNINLKTYLLRVGEVCKIGYQKELANQYYSLSASVTSMMVFPATSIQDIILYKKTLSRSQVCYGPITTNCDAREP